MAFLDEAKKILRISSTAFDDEIVNLIIMCKTDLRLSGLVAIDEADPLIKRAIYLYVKANFGWNNSESERWQSLYVELKNQLCTSNEYAYYTVTIKANQQGDVTFDEVTKKTNQLGIAVFYSKEKNHVMYTVDGVTSYIDIIGNTTIGG